MSIKSDLIDLIKKDKRILIAEIMPDEMKKEVLKCEMQRLEELVPFINEGMEEAFQETEAIVLVIDNTIEYEGPEDLSDTQSSFTLRTLILEGSTLIETGSIYTRSPAEKLSRELRLL